MKAIAPAQPVPCGVRREKLLEPSEVESAPGRCVTKGIGGLASPHLAGVVGVPHLVEAAKARTMRRDVGKLLYRVAAAVAGLDIFELLAVHSEDGVLFHEWGAELRPSPARVGTSQVSRAGARSGDDP